MMECGGKGTPESSLTLDQVAKALRAIRTIEDILPELACLIPLLVAMPRGKTDAAKHLPDGRKRREKSTGPMKLRRVLHLELMNRIDPMVKMGGEGEESILSVYKTLRPWYEKFLDGALKDLPSEPPRGKEKDMLYLDIFWKLSRQRNRLFFSYTTFKTLARKRYSEKWGLSINEE
jgi:hypothetical protein